MKEKDRPPKRPPDPESLLLVVFGIAAMLFILGALLILVTLN